MMRARGFSSAGAGIRGKGIQADPLRVGGVLGMGRRLNGLPETTPKIGIVDHQILEFIKII